MDYIPWNSNVAKGFTDGHNSDTNTINNSYLVMRNTAQSVALEIPGASQRYNTAKSSIENAIQRMKNRNVHVGGKIHAIPINDLEFKIRQVRQKLAEQKADVGKKSELLNLRKEQAAALKDKYEGNYHSSWLGLYRPLKDESQVGLSVAAGIFGFLALLTLGYVVYTYYMTRSGGGAGINVGSSGTYKAPAAPAANNIFAAMSGGLRKKN